MIKSFIQLMSSSIIAPILAFIYTTMLVKVLTIDEYAIYAYSTNVFAMLYPALSCGFAVSIRSLAGESNQDSSEREILSSGLIYVFLKSFILLLVALVFIEYVAKVDARPYMLTFSWVVFINACNVVLDNYLQGANEIKLLSIYRLLQKLLPLTLLFIFSLDWIRFGLTEALLTYYVSSLICLFITLYFLRKNINIRDGIVAFKNLTNRVYTFGFNIYLGSVVSLISLYIAPIIVGQLSSSTTELGLYMLATALTAPLMVVPQVLSTIYYRNFVSLKFLERKVIVGLLLMSLIALVICNLCTPLIVYFFGQDYKGAIPIFRVLSLFYIINGLNLFLDRFFNATGDAITVRNSSVLSGVLLILLYVMLIVMNYNQGVEYALLISSFFGLILKIKGYYINYEK
ncbi:oligosaccharide flippase family protein [Vibrio breoganii]